MARTKTVPEIENRGSLLTYTQDGHDRCFGFLFYSPEHGTFEPTFGKLDVTQEEADTHNRLLSQALIDGLDHRCEVGQGGMFHAAKEGGRYRVQTWTGDVVSDAPRKQGRVLTFRRGEKVFRGLLRRDDDLVYVERVA